MQKPEGTQYSAYLCQTTYQYFWLFGTGRSLHSTDDFQTAMETSLSQGKSLVKFSWRYDQQLLSSGQVHHCWCLVEVWALQMFSILLWGLGLKSISGKIFAKIW